MKLDIDCIIKKSDKSEEEINSSTKNKSWSIDNFLKTESNSNEKMVQEVNENNRNSVHFSKDISLDFDVKLSGMKRLRDVNKIKAVGKKLNIKCVTKCKKKEKGRLFLIEKKRKE